MDFPIGFSITNLRRLAGLVQLGNLVGRTAILKDHVIPSRFLPHERGVCSRGKLSFDQLPLSMKRRTVGLVSVTRFNSGCHGVWFVKEFGARLKVNHLYG